MSQPYTAPTTETLEERIIEAMTAAENLEAECLLLAREAGHGAIGRQLNIAATQVGLGAGQLMRAAHDLGAKSG